MNFQDKIYPACGVAAITCLILSITSCERYLVQGEPKVVTKPVTGITDITALSGGEVSSRDTYGDETPILARGIVWGTKAQPTLENNEGIIVDWEGDGTDNAGVGDFEAMMTGLAPDTDYHVRAYAKNKNGIGYGVDREFRTLDDSGGGCPSSVADVDGNVYTTVRIGNQCWMKENLKTPTFRNGTAIPGQGAFLYDYEPSWKDPYGALYTFATVADQQGLCPYGWHVPSHDEWEVLINFLGGPEVAGGRLKSPRTHPFAHPRWDEPNTLGNSDSGFAAFPGGYRWTDGKFYDLGAAGLFYSSTAYDNDWAWLLMLIHDGAEAGLSTELKGRGCSVRCIKD